MQAALHELLEAVGLQQGLVGEIVQGMSGVQLNVRVRCAGCRRAGAAQAEFCLCLLHMDSWHLGREEVESKQQSSALNS